MCNPESFLKKCFFILLFLALYVPLHAQDAHVEIRYTRKEPPIVVNDPGEGLLVSVGKKLHYYTLDGKLAWEQEWTRVWPTQGLVTEFNEVVVSPSLSYIYQITGKEAKKLKNFTGKNSGVVQIKKDGTKKEFQLPELKEMGTNLQTIFCDDQYLAVLTTEKGDENFDKDKSGDKMILNRFTNDNQSYSRIVLELPPIEDDNFLSKFWQYTGRAGDLHYLASKSIAGENVDRNTIDLVGFTMNGEIKFHKTINIELANGKFTRPSRHYSSGRTHANFQNFDFMMGQTGLFQDVGAFQGFTVDYQHQCFYAFGLLGPDLFKRVASQYEGFYIIKYDLQGNELWRMQRTGDEEFKDRVFWRGAAAIGRSLSLSALPDGRLHVNLFWVNDNSMSYEVSADGKVLAKKKGLGDWTIEPGSTRPETAAESFVKSQPGSRKGITYSIREANKAYIVTHNDEKELIYYLDFIKR